MRPIALLMVLLAVIGCGQRSGEPDAGQVPSTLRLAEGVPIPVATLAFLNVDSPAGTEVPMMVAEDVVVDGRVAIPLGTLVVGSVAGSKGSILEVHAGEGTLGTDTPFSVRGTAEPGGVLRLDALGEPDALVATWMATDSDRTLLESIVLALESDSLADVLGDPENCARVKDMLDDRGLTNGDAWTKRQTHRDADAFLIEVRNGRWAEASKKQREGLVEALLDFLALASDAGLALDLEDARIPMGKRATVYLNKAIDVPKSSG